MPMTSGFPRSSSASLPSVKAHPRTRAVQCGVYYVDDSFNVLQERRCTQPDDTLLTFLRFQNLPGVASTWLIAREAFDEMGWFDPELTILEDWDISIKAARFCNPISMPEPLTLVRVHPDNRSRNLDIHIAPGFRVLGRLFADPDLPDPIRRRKREIYGRFYTMLCGGAFRARRWRDCAYWGARAVRTDPRMLGYIVAMPVRRLAGASYRSGAGLNRRLRSAQQ